MWHRVKERYRNFCFVKKISMRKSKPEVALKWIRIIVHELIKFLHFTLYTVYYRPNFGTLEVNIFFVVCLFGSFFICLGLEFLFDVIQIHRNGRKTRLLGKKAYEKEINFIYKQKIRIRIATPYIAPYIATPYATEMLNIKKHENSGILR